MNTYEQSLPGWKTTIATAPIGLISRLPPFLSLQKKEEVQVIDWEQQFSVVSINRADLTEFGFTDEQIATIFTNEVMTEIAEKMQERYFLTSSYFFWQDLKQATESFTQVPHERRTMYGKSSQPLREESDTGNSV